MIMRARPIDGSFVVVPEPKYDERGFLARTFDADEFARAGLVSSFVQSSIAFNARRGTLRGLHYQLPPHEEAKLVRCTRGAAYDVVADLRPASPTYLRWDAVEIRADDPLAVYVPAGCAHGYLTLEDESELAYDISHPYVAEAAAGVRWDDPMLAIEWPAEPTVISRRDASLPALAAPTERA